MHSSMKLGLLAAFTLTSSSAFAAPCDGFDSYASKISEKYQEVCKGNCDKAKQTAQKLNEWISWWNNMVGNSWAKIGPRNYNFGSSSNGTIQSIGKRVWVSTTTSDNNTVSIKIQKTDGKGPVNYNICTLNPETKQISVLTSGSFEQGNGKSAQTKAVSGVTGKFVIVEILGKNPTLKFGYDLQVQ